MRTGWSIAFAIAEHPRLGLPSSVKSRSRISNLHCPIQFKDNTSTASCNHSFTISTGCRNLNFLWSTWRSETEKFRPCILLARETQDNAISLSAQGFVCCMQPTVDKFRFLDPRNGQRTKRKEGAREGPVPATFGSIRTDPDNLQRDMARADRARNTAAHIHNQRWFKVLHELHIQNADFICYLRDKADGFLPKSMIEVSESEALRVLVWWRVVRFNEEEGRRGSGVRKQWVFKLELHWWDDPSFFIKSTALVSELRFRRRRRRGKKSNSSSLLLVVLKYGGWSSFAHREEGMVYWIDRDVGRG